MEKDVGGRPEFVPTDEQRAAVKVLIAARSTKEEIAGYLEISVPTLNKHVPEELARGYYEILALAILAFC